MAAGTVHLIHGYLCSGKTTFASELERRCAGIRLSLDEWMIRLTGEPVHLDDDLYERLYRLAAELWPRIAGRGIDVVLDFGFWRRARRDEARATAAEIGVPVRLYWVRCPDAEARRRCLERNRTPGADYYIDENGFEALRAKYEPLGSDEEYQVVETG